MATTTSNTGSTLRGVEIFAAGVVRDKRWTDRDLNEMVESFEAFSTGARPLLRVPLILGHGEDQAMLERDDLPSAGWCDKVYRRGHTLFADFSDVPTPVARLIKSRG